MSGLNAHKSVTVMLLCVVLLPCCRLLRHRLLCRGALLHVMSLQLRCHPWCGCAVAVAAVWSCHGALLCVVSLSCCRSLRHRDRAAACYVMGCCYVSCCRSRAAAHGPPCGRGCCGVVVPRGAAAHRVATTVLPRVSPGCAGAQRAAIAFAAHHATALLQTEPKSEKEK